MDAKELFSAAVRVVGLLSFGRGFFDLVYVLLLNLGLWDASVVTDKYNANLIYGLMYFLIGLYLLRGARLVVNFAFPGDQEKTGRTRAEDFEDS